MSGVHFLSAILIVQHIQALHLKGSRELHIQQAHISSNLIWPCPLMLFANTSPFLRVYRKVSYAKHVFWIHGTDLKFRLIPVSCCNSPPDETDYRGPTLFLLCNVRIWLPSTLDYSRKLTLKCYTFGSMSLMRNSCAITVSLPTTVQCQA